MPRADDDLESAHVQPFVNPIPARQNPHSLTETNRIHWVENLKPLPPIPSGEKRAIKSHSPHTRYAAPAKIKISRWTRIRIWFNTYKKLFTLVLTFNLIAIFMCLSGKWPYARSYTGAFVLGNLQTAVLVRNEWFTRFLYLYANTCFARWPPLWFRLACTSTLQHLGGIHSGCALSAVLWLLFRVVQIGIHANSHLSKQVLVTGTMTFIAVAVGIISAIPWVRNNHHNVFERYHRFSGWIGLILTWAFVSLSNSYIASSAAEIHSDTPHNPSSRFVRQQDFWFALFTSILVITPWLTVRRVPVHVEIPSPKVAILHFERGMQQGLLARISRTPVWEYHAFGIVSSGTRSKCHYLICGVQGDFTKKLVQDPPSYLYTRQLKCPGVSNTSTLYRRGVRVCTGTGIGAALSTCLQSPDWYLIWIGADQEKTFGHTISSLIQQYIVPERMTLWDSRQRGGRPDVMTLITDVFCSWNAEVVFITSNWQGNKEMMEGCKEAGIPAFGTLWDF